MELMTIKEVAEFIRMPESTLRFWRHRGTGPRSFKIGARVAYKRSDVDAWVEEQYKASRVVA